MAYHSFAHLAIAAIAAPGASLTAMVGAAILGAEQADVARSFATNRTIEYGGFDRGHLFAPPQGLASAFLRFLIDNLELLLFRLGQFHNVAAQRLARVSVLIPHANN